MAAAISSESSTARTGSGSGRILPADAILSPPAGLGRRIAAFAIDLTFLGILGVLLSFFVFGIAFSILPGNDTENGGLVTFFLALIGLMVLSLALPVVYGWVSTASTHQGTPGKSIMKLAVVRVPSGAPLNGWFAALRAFVLWLLLFSGFFLAALGLSVASVLLPLMPVILIAVAFSDPERRSLHDQFADTRVILDPRESANT